MGTAVRTVKFLRIQATFDARRSFRDFSTRCRTLAKKVYQLFVGACRHNHEVRIANPRQSASKVRGKQIV